MKETIVTVQLQPTTAKKTAKVWQSAAFAATCNTKKWTPIVADGIFTISSEVGSFNLNNRSFASGMMCDLKEWKKYRTEFVKIAMAIDSKAVVVAKEVVLDA